MSVIGMKLARSWTIEVLARSVLRWGSHRRSLRCERMLRSVLLASNECAMKDCFLRFARQRRVTKSDLISLLKSCPIIFWNEATGTLLTSMSKMEEMADGLDSLLLSFACRLS